MERETAKKIFLSDKFGQCFSEKEIWILINERIVYFGETLNKKNRRDF